MSKLELDSKEELALIALLQRRLTRVCSGRLGQRCLFKLVQAILSKRTLQKNFKRNLRFDKTHIRMKLKANIVIPSKLANTDKIFGY